MLARRCQSLFRSMQALQQPARHNVVSNRAYASAAGYQCMKCGQNYAKWQGQCSSCSAWGAVGPIQQSARGKVAWGQRNGTNNGLSNLPATTISRMTDIELEGDVIQRIVLQDRELNWVFGGGVVPGSLTLIAGNPGVGKSTLGLQVANMLSSTKDVLYVSGEESVSQLKLRAERLDATSPNLCVASETNIDAILQAAESTSENGLRFQALVVDSIQTIYAEDMPSAAGAVNQVKECTLRLLRLAKSHQLPVFIVGHVTKSGDIAGPKVLEHIVDTVVQLDGDSQSSRRFLRCQKNRFGPTSEVGVFSMTDSGLHSLSNPLHAFLPSQSSDAGGGAVDGSSYTITMEGTRPIPLEIQALANRSVVSDGRPQVRGVGVSFDKLLLLFAVLEKRARISCYRHSVFVNVAEGYSVQEPAADLAMATALASSVMERPVLPGTMLIGEIALSGHVRPVKALDSRLAAAHKIGMERCIVPRVHDAESKQMLDKYKGQMQVDQVSTLLDALQIALPPSSRK